MLISTYRTTRCLSWNFAVKFQAISEKTAKKSWGNVFSSIMCVEMTIYSDHCKYLCYCFANNCNVIMNVGSTQTLCWYAMSSLCPVYLSSLATLHLLSTTLAIPFHWPLQIGIQQTSEVAMLLKAFWLIRQHTSLLLWLFSGFTVYRGQRQTIELTLWADAATQLNTCVFVYVLLGWWVRVMMRRLGSYVWRQNQVEILSSLTTSYLLFRWASLSLVVTD